LWLPWEHTTHQPRYIYADFAKITAPTLILSGDRDEFCTVEQALAAFRQLPHGELAVLPGHGHYIPPAAITTAIEYFERQLSS
jgi:pimeloyl-ACP methyl ester carboxylesterase